jgi:hypothetical protein
MNQKIGDEKAVEAIKKELEKVTIGIEFLKDEIKNLGE